MAARKGGLGRGLDALFADAAPLAEEAKDVEETAAEDKSSNRKTAEGKPETSGETGRKQINRTDNDRNSDDDTDRVIYIDINDIRPNADQPRRNFNEDRLKELADSIKENGVIQPLIVRRKDRGYELVAGERRWRASRLAGFKTVPCIIRDFDERQNAIVAIIENMQREDLNPIEEAAGIYAMTRKYGFTQEQVSTSLGKSRAYIANSMRLLKLPEEVKAYVVDGNLSAAHGRTLLGIDDSRKQKEIAYQIISEGLSVRATEALVEKIKENTQPEKKKRKSSKPEEITAVENELRSLSGTKVTITGDSTSGKINLEYYSLEELNRLIDLLREAFK